jgi:DNA invertase Pin-like site-specific DNA recombinase/DNA-binding CsgD family transcriptional regulator
MARHWEFSRPTVPEDDGVMRLTARQVEILELAAQGLSGKQIGRYLDISVRTVEGHFSDMRQRTGARNDVELVAYGVAAGLVTPARMQPQRPAVRHKARGRGTSEPKSRPNPEKSDAAANGHEPDGGQCRQPVPEINVGKRPSGRLRHLLVGYARASTHGENPDHQIDALLRAGVDRSNIHIDIAGGTKSTSPALDFVLKLLQPGDILKVTRLDRLASSVLHLVTLGASLRQRGIGLHVIEQDIDSCTVQGGAMYAMLSVLAELQHDLISANTRDRLAAARTRGRTGGRHPRLTPDQAALAQQLYDAREKTVQQIASIFNVPRSTIYDYLKRERTILRQPKKL